MSRLVAKLYGIIDILAAVIILFGIPAPNAIKLVIVLIMLIKGIPSLVGDMFCRVYAVFDIMAAVIIFMAFAAPDILKVAIASIMVFKGVPSLL